MSQDIYQMSQNIYQMSQDIYQMSQDIYQMSQDNICNLTFWWNICEFLHFGGIFINFTWRQNYDMRLLMKVETHPEVVPFED